MSPDLQAARKESCRLVAMLARRPLAGQVAAAGRVVDIWCCAAQLARAAHRPGSSETAAAAAAVVLLLTRAAATLHTIDCRPGSPHQTTVLWPGQGRRQHNTE